MIRMIFVILWLALLSGAYAAVCDATYSFNKALLYTGTGSHVNSLQFSETEIDLNFSIPVIRENPFDYRFPTEFKSQCSSFGIFPATPSYAIFAERDSGTTDFVIGGQVDRWIRFMSLQPFTNGPTAKNIMLMFNDTAANAKDYVIEDSTDNIYKITYGAAIYYDTLYLNGAPIGLGHGSFGWTVKFDTSYFMTDLKASSLNSSCTDNAGWTDNPDYSCTRDFRVHMLVVHYDTLGGVPPSINLTSPTGGEEYEVGQQVEITWTNVGSIPAVDVQYSTGGAWNVMADSIQNTGSFTWTVPNELSATVRLRVIQRGGTAGDTSTADFSIVAPVNKTLSLTTPNGGEKFQVGSTLDITWTSTGNITNIRIDLFSDGSIVRTLVASTFNNGTYSWTVPDEVSSTMRIKITDFASGVSDESDGDFEIAAIPVPKTLWVLTPINNDEFIGSDTIYITWASTGGIDSVLIGLKDENGKNDHRKVPNIGAFALATGDLTVQGNVTLNISTFDSTVMADTTVTFSIISPPLVLNQNIINSAFTLSLKGRGVLFRSIREDVKLVRIYNTAGKLLKSLDIHFNRVTLSPEYFKKGIYLVELVHASGRDFGKFVTW